MYATADEDGDAVSSLKLRRMFGVESAAKYGHRCTRTSAMPCTSRMIEFILLTSLELPARLMIQSKSNQMTSLQPIASLAIRLRISGLVRGQIKRCATCTLCTIWGGRRGEIPAARPRYRNIVPLCVTQRDIIVEVLNVLYQQLLLRPR